MEQIRFEIVLKGRNFVKNDIFLFKKADAHLQYVCNDCAKFQIDCLITVRGVDYTNFLEGTDGRTDGQTDGQGKIIIKNTRMPSKHIMSFLLIWHEDKNLHKML